MQENRYPIALISMDLHIRQFARRNADFFARFDICHGFLDGGCYCFARALAGILAGDAELACVYSGEIPQHVVVSWQGMLWDAEGMHTEQEMTRKIERDLLNVQDASKCRVMRPDPDLLEEDLDEWEILDYREIGLPEILREEMVKYFSMNAVGTLAQCGSTEVTTACPPPASAAGRRSTAGLH